MGTRPKLSLVGDATPRTAPTVLLCSASLSSGMVLPAATATMLADDPVSPPVDLFCMLQDYSIAYNTGRMHDAVQCCQDLVRLAVTMLESTLEQERLQRRPRHLS